MRTFPAAFTTEKNKTSGAKPRTLMVVRFATGTVYLSDQAFTIANWPGEGSPVTKAWIRSWGAIDEQVVAQLAAPVLSDLTLEFIDDPNDASRWSELLEDATNNPYQTDCELYLWFEGLDASTDPPQKLWQGTVLDRGESAGELLVRTRFRDQLLKIDKAIGRTLNLTDFPSADPDDVGKFLPIVVGSVKQVPALAIVAGGESTLVAGIPSGATTLQISDATFFPSAMPFTIQVENEQFSVTGKGTTPEHFIVTPAFGGTTAQPHDAGQAAWEVRSDFTYHCSDRLMQSIDRVYAKVRGELVDITADVTVHPTGNGSFPNQAVIVAPNKPTVGREVNLSVTDPLPVSQVAHDHDTTVQETKVQQATDAFPKSISFTRLSDIPSAVSFAAVSGTFVTQTVEMDVEVTILHIEDNLSGGHECDQFGVRFEVGNSGFTAPLIPTTASNNTSPTAIKGRTAVIMTSTTADDTVRSLAFKTFDSSGTGCSFVTGSVTIYKASRTIESTVVKTATQETVPNLVKTDPATLSGNSSAERVIGEQVLFDGRGIEDDGSGTVTGLANRLITRPDHVVKQFLNAELSFPLANIDTPSDFVDVTADVPLLSGHRDPRTWVSLGIKAGDTNPITSAVYKAGDNVRVTQPVYHLDGVLDRKEPLSRWLTAWAWQSRCYVRMAAGRATLLFRPDSLTSAKTLTKANVRRARSGSRTSLRRRWSGLEEIVNVIEIFGDRQWDKPGGDPEAYQKTARSTDSASITRYGEKERPELFFFDFLTEQSLMNTLRDFYLARLKDEHRRLLVDVFLDQIELEFADAITLQHPLIKGGSLVGELKKANYRPGSGRDRRLDALEVTLQEY